MARWSQKDEEDWIVRATLDIQNGVFLDIGAYDGCNYSNTMALVERGWRGVMVEPGLDAFKSLLSHHGGNEKITLIHAAVVLAGMPVVQFWHNATTYSTTEPKNKSKFAHEKFSSMYWSGAISLDAVLAFQPHYDVVSIDTEGTSVDLFKAFLETGRVPRVICVEHDGRIEECVQAAKAQQYELVAQNSENLIFQA
jgi:FkbM family methyltransferase